MKTRDSNEFSLVEYIPLPHPQDTSHPLKGALYLLLGVFSYAIANIFIKTSSQYYPFGEMVVLRGLVLLIPLIIYVLLRYFKKLQSFFFTRHLKIHIVQGILSTFCLYFLFYAFSVLPLSDATAISFSETFILSLLALLFLKEKITSSRWIAISVGFIGVLVITQPNLGIFNLHSKGVLACLLAVTFDAGVLLSLRKIGKQDKALTILIYYALFSTMGGCLFFPFEHWTPVLKEHLFDILALGFFGALGQIFITHAFRHAETSVLAPLVYTQLIWALLFDHFIWARWPDLSVLVGATIIILSGIYLLRKEHLSI